MSKDTEQVYERGALIFNSASGQTGEREKIGDVADVLLTAVGELTLLKSRAPGDTEKLCRERGSDYDIVVILGGDGTVHEGINGLSLLDEPPAVGILPGGTSNDFARGLGMSMDLREAARRVTEGRPVRMDVGRANDRYFSNFIGTGLVAEVSQDTDRSTKDSAGRLGYYIELVKNAAENDEFGFTLTTEDETVKETAAAIIAVNGSFIGGIEIPKKDTGRDDGLLDLYIVYKPGLSLILDYLRDKDSLKHESTDEKIRYLRTSRFELSTSERRAADMDGEVYMETPLEVAAGEKKLAFITGEG